MLHYGTNIVSFLLVTEVPENYIKSGKMYSSCHQNLEHRRVTNTIVIFQVNMLREKKHVVWEIAY